MRIKKITLINIVILLTLILVGCDSSTESENQPHVIIGTWDLTELEGSGISVNSSNSIWAFEADGTYEWFLLIESFDLEGQGTYSLDGNTLTIDDGLSSTRLGTRLRARFVLLHSESLEAGIEPESRPRVGPATRHRD